MYTLMSVKMALLVIAIVLGVICSVNAENVKGAVQLNSGVFNKVYAIMICYT